MGFWQALSALAPVAPAMAAAQDLRTQRAQEAQAFSQDQQLKDAQLTAQKLAAEGEKQRIAQAGQPVIIGEPQWNPTTHSNQVLTFDRNTGALALKDAPGIDPQAVAEGRYQAARTDFRKTAGRDLTPAEDQSLFFQSYGLKTPAELTPFQSLEFNQPKLSMTGGVPTVGYQGHSFTTADLKDPQTPPEVKKLLENGQAALDQKQAVIDKRLDMEQRRNDMANQRLLAALKNSPDGPVPGNPNLIGEAYLATLPASERTLVQGIGTGRAGIERLSYLLTRNPRLLNEVIQAYPDFDSSKVQSYISAYRDFTTGKASEQLKSGANAIQHLYQLKAINDADPVAVHNASTASYKRYSALLNVVTGELAKFYGMPQTNENRKQLRDPLSDLFNRNSAIMEQANAMGVAFNDLQSQWTNAKPSSAYQAPLPGLNASAMKALKELAPDQYQQFVGGGATAGRTSGRTGNPAPTGMVNVQIPGQPPGQIPASALQKFQHDYPNAQVIQ